MHVVQYSGGISSWGAAVRVVARFGAENTVLVFADTLVEHPDTYRFLEESASWLGARLVRLAKGESIWDVFKRRKFLGNSRNDPCSETLKRRVLRTYMNQNHDPERDVLYFGLDWTEGDRIGRVKERWAPWTVVCPLADWDPPKDKQWWIDMAKEVGLPSQALYEAGMPHANCGGGCVKAGISHFVMLYHRFPETFAEWERNEEDVRRHIGKDVAILTDRRNGKRRPMTLATLRERIEAGDPSLPKDEFGGCNCIVG